MEPDIVMGDDKTAMRWDLLQSQLPSTTKFTARLAVPSRTNDVFIAVDAANRRYVLVRIPQEQLDYIAERPSRGIAVQTVEMKLDDSGRSAVFVEIACLEQSGYAAMDIVTMELVDAIQANNAIGRVRLIRNVLMKWRRFWADATQGLLSKEQQRGLFGELWFLARWILPNTEIEPAIQMWRGPVGARNDFESQGLAVEVKTSGKLDGSHIINGLEQLLVPPNANLFLFSFLVREESSGVESLPKLVLEIRAAIGENYSALSQFESMLAAAGYEDAHSNEYEKIKYRTRSECLYRVTAGFPRLVPNDIPGLPAGVGNVSYEIRLDGAGAWLVTDNPVEFGALLKSHD